ncbi:MAG TPA: dTMP kinase [Thermoanaerobaculia bacterium]|jgi:dTMP kinase
MSFVTFEGVEGSGKSTQLHLAAARLRAAGRAVRTTREPGGTPIGEAIRALLVPPEEDTLDPVAEWLLYEADRRQHVRDVLKPALARGEIVLCDRYSDATEAYQLAGRGVDPEAIARVDAMARDGLLPDLTLLYDMDPEAGIARAVARDGGRRGRFEAAALDFHRRVREAYLAIARREPGRVVVIDAARNPEQIFEDTWRVLQARIPS